ncbi:MAG: exosortase/archaeosortase family protein [Bryobacteraceae bacterium]
MATSSDNLVAETNPGQFVPPVPWATLAWFGILLIVCYAPILKHLVGQWISDEDMGHGFFVPLVAGYIAWQRREELLSPPLRPNYWGFAIMLLGAAWELVGTLGAQIVVQRTAFLVSLVGVIVVLGGMRALRTLTFPLFLLLFMIPIPAVIYGQITLPLQLFASKVAETVLSWLGIPVLREGNILELASQRLSVVEACSGIRSLLSLSFLSLIYAYFFDSKVWMRYVLLVATVPIAIIANAGRVTITGILSEYRTDLAQGAFHEMEGWVIFVIALMILIAFHRFVNWVYARVRAKEGSPDGISN